MTRDVVVKIKGIQSDGSQGGEHDNAPVEVITSASYFCKNGKHYIVYDEVAEGVKEITKNKIKIAGEDSLEVLKSGNVNAHLYFDRASDSRTLYKTPFGHMAMDVHTKDIVLTEEDEHIHVNLTYGLDMNNAPLADCQIEIDIRPRSAEALGF